MVGILKAAIEHLDSTECSTLTTFTNTRIGSIRGVKTTKNSFLFRLCVRLRNSAQRAAVDWDPKWLQCSTRTLVMRTSTLCQLSMWARLWRHLVPPTIQFKNSHLPPKMLSTSHRNNQAASMWQGQITRTQRPTCSTSNKPRPFGMQQTRAMTLVGKLALRMITGNILASTRWVASSSRHRTKLPYSLISRIHCGWPHWQPIRKRTMAARISTRNVGKIALVRHRTRWMLRIRSTWG